MTRRIINLRSRDWRTQLKAALDAAFGDPLSEPTPKDMDATLKGLQ